MPFNIWYRSQVERDLAYDLMAQVYLNPKMMIRHHVPVRQHV
jgi:hypothetical protein